MTTFECIQEFEESARRHFKDFVPTYKKLDDMEVLDWRNANGSINYYVRYVFDTNVCKLYVSGDLGAGVFALTWKPTLANTAPRASSYDYMLEKLSLGCSSDLFTYDENLARDELTEKFNNDKTNIRKAAGEAFCTKKSIEDTVDIFLDSYNRSGFDMAELSASTYGEAKDFIEAFDQDYFDWFFDLGKVIHPRVIAWLIGMRMAYDMLKERGEDV